MLDFELESKRYDVESREKWREWCSKMPSLQFDPDWDVKIIPPYGGAMARFAIYRGDEYCCDVYFDVYSRLGWEMDDANEPVPYFELYPWEGDCKRYYINEVDELMRDIKTIMTERSLPWKN